MNGVWALIAAVIAFGITAIMGKWMIPFLHKINSGQTIRDEGPKWHKKKQGTPTMGGIMFIIGILIATVVAVPCYWQISSDNVFQMSETGLMATKIFAGLCLALGYGLIGYLDDYIKVVRKRNLGLTVKQKLILQFLVAAAYLAAIYLSGGTGTTEIPFVGLVDLGWAYWLIAAVLIVGVVNAVNFTDGIDGLCCNAGVSGACGNLKLMISLNYFGATNLAHGLFDLLKKKGGSCVVTSSNTISQGAARMDLVDMLNYSQTKPVNEERILNIIEKFDESSLAVGNSIYVTTKYALARWARRVSASWAANGVRINTVAPGNVSTPMTATMSENAKAALAALPIPINYGTDTLMDPEDIANVIAFLVSPLAHGINGNVLFVDGGTDALLNSEKVY